MAESRLTQEAVEVARDNSGAAARSTQEAVEVLRNLPPVSAGLTQLAVEVLAPTAGFLPRKLTAAMPPDVDVTAGFQIQVTALDPVTGAAVSGVTISNMAILAAQLSGGDPGDLQAGPFQLIPLDVQP